jgi:NADPH:quinone reductase-like Zn-dependent oxidoreductase
VLKAVFFHTHGGIDVLEYGDLETPLPSPNEVQIKLQVSALNHSDIWVRKGWPGLNLKMPHILGGDGAGLVSKLGSAVTDFKHGDRVVINPSIGCGVCAICLSGEDNYCKDWHLLGESIPGTNAEYVVVPAKNLLRVPDGFELRMAAAAGLVYLTAWHSLVTRGNLKADETVLIVGASGGVNTASIQVAKYLGSCVFVVGSNKEKLALAKSLGADELIDRSQDQDWSERVWALTDKKGVDVVVDNVGAGAYPMSMRAARKGGRILTVGNTGGAVFEIDNRYIFGKHLSIIGSTMGTIQDFNHVMSLVFQGHLEPVFDREFPLSEASKAQHRLETGTQMGKITLAI